MRFGGHETFTIRDGWLHKGLNLLQREPEKLVDEFSADWLGVGSNMAKAIRHWLIAAGLARHEPGKRSKTTLLVPTELGNLIYTQDSNFTELGTWWVLHANLVNNKENAVSWDWFFNYFNHQKFDKSVCLDNACRYFQNNKTMPSINTLDRDLLCLLGSYARKIPTEQNDDPEDARDCPLLDLGIMSYFRMTGTYQINYEVKNIPPEIFCYIISMTFGQTNQSGGSCNVTIQEAVTRPGGPGRICQLQSESLYEQAAKAEGIMQNQDIELVGLGGSRVIKFANKQPLEWLEKYYSTTK